MNHDLENDRLAVQPTNEDERRFLVFAGKVVEDADVDALVFWTYDCPEYPGLDDELWERVSADDPAAQALVIDYDGVVA